MGTENHKHQRTGSDPNDEPVFFQIGRLQKAHGINGEIKLSLSVNFSLDVSIGSSIFIGPTHTSYLVTSMRGQLNPVIISFEGITDRETVQKLTNQNVYIRLEQLPQQNESNFYFHEVIGMDVRDENGELIGKIREIIETGANDVYVVDQVNRDKEILIPAIKSVVQEINRKTKMMIVRLPKWD